MEIIIRPIVTEKMTKLTEKQHKYGFIVAKNANKLQIKLAIEKMYPVSVEAVNTLVVPAKSVKRFTKKGFTSGRKPGYKKAYVTVGKNDVIDYYGNV
jgi:large subunit ribosomal protein L23